MSMYNNTVTNMAAIVHFIRADDKGRRQRTTTTTTTTTTEEWNCAVQKTDDTDERAFLLMKIWVRGAERVCIVLLLLYPRLT
jgi:hypothetical protein